MHNDLAERNLTDEEQDALVMALAYGSGEDGFTEQDGINLLDWIQTVVIGVGLVQNLLDGHINVKMIDKKPVFALTEDGHNYALQMLGGVLEESGQDD